MSEPATSVQLVNTRSPQEFAEVIRTEGQDRVKSIFTTAMWVETAREELGPARWLKELIQGELKWSKSYGYQYCLIAKDSRLSEVKHVSLPPDTATLVALARLTDEQFQHGLDTGIIHAGMERKDIKALKPPKEKPPCGAAVSLSRSGGRRWPGWVRSAITRPPLRAQR
jgi:hypothetical protein